MLQNETKKAYFFIISILVWKIDTGQLILNLKNDKLHLILKKK